MKVKKFRAPRLVVATAAQGRTVLRGFWALVLEHKLLSAAFFIATFTLGACLWPMDSALLQRLHFWPASQEEIARRISWDLGTWGDFPTYNLPFAVAIWFFGLWRKSSAWRRVAVVCLLGATLAGLCDDALRLTAGRPRPDAHVADGFYGIRYAIEGRYQSFPSGHAASVFGAAAALLVVEFPLGIIATAFACAVVWARLELYRHYPSDVLVGSLIGIYFGFMVGWGAQVRLNKIKSDVEAWK